MTSPANSPTASGRCFEPIVRRDLARLAGLVRREREDFFRLNAGWSLLYSKRLLASVLAGAAAAHHVNGSSGFDRFEVWSFFAVHPEAPFPVRRQAREDFGVSRFGRDPGAPESFAGRGVDLRGRSVDAGPADSPVSVLHRYLGQRRTPTARTLSGHTLVLLEPDTLLGYVAWPTLLPE